MKKVYILFLAKRWEERLPLAVYSSMESAERDAGRLVAGHEFPKGHPLYKMSVKHRDNLEIDDIELLEK